MFVYNAQRKKVQLVPLETEFVTDRVSRRATVAVRRVQPEREPTNTSGLVARAARAFFEVGRAGSGKAAAAASSEPKGPPPVCFRESTTGLLHMVYRELVIRFRAGLPSTTRSALLKKYGFKVRRVNPYFKNQVIVYNPQRQYSGEKLLEIANDIADTDDVEFSAPNFVSQYRRYAVPAIRSEEWHLKNKGSGGAKKNEDVDAPAAWEVTTGKRSIVVAVVDDGVDIDHPNLKGNIWRNPTASAKDKFGRDFFLDDDHPDHFNPRPKIFQFPFDDVETNDIHGTPCAGVIAAVGHDGGSTGIAPECRILPVKIFHGINMVRDERVADALRYSATIADIVSCSWGVSEASVDVQHALADLGSARNGRGVAIFCAAGNEEHEPVGFPASDPNAIAITASTDKATLASYSNVGPEASMCAPSNGGVRAIFTTDVSIPGRGFNLGAKETGGKDGLHTNDFGGTSSATPLAAGVAALVLSVRSNLSRDALREVLQNTADKIGRGYDANGHSDRFGFGRVNAGKAIDHAAGMAPLAAKKPAKKPAKKR